MVKASAVENTDSASSASRESMDGASCHGRSIDEADRNSRIAVPHSIEPAAGTHRIESLEAPPEDRRAGIADGGGDDRELRHKLLAEPAQRFQPDDQADARHARHHAEQLAGGRRLVPHDAATVSRKVKIGEVELRMVARPASTVCSAQAISVKGTTLLRQACTRKRRQAAASRGSAMPRSRITSSSIEPGDQGARRDQGHRRNRLHADLDEGVGGAPQGRQYS